MFQGDVGRGGTRVGDVSASHEGGGRGEERSGREGGSSRHLAFQGTLAIYQENCIVHREEAKATGAGGKDRRRYEEIQV